MLLEGYFSKDAGLSIARDRPPAVIAAPVDTFDDEAKEDLRSRGHLLFEIASDDPNVFLNAKSCAEIAAKRLESRAELRRLTRSRVAEIRQEDSGISYAM
jgi:hypothetical protein